MKKWIIILIFQVCGCTSNLDKNEINSIMGSFEQNCSTIQDSLDQLNTDYLLFLKRHLNSNISTWLNDRFYVLTKLNDNGYQLDIYRPDNSYRNIAEINMNNSFSKLLNCIDKDTIDCVINSTLNIQYITEIKIKNRNIKILSYYDQIIQNECIQTFQNNLISKLSEIEESL